MKIAAVVQRYGDDVIGGAESLARELCTRLSAEHEITVITSQALDYRTWENALPLGESREDGVKIIRCPVTKIRRWKSFGRFSSLLFAWNRHFPVPRFVQDLWISAQGPFCPTLPGIVEDESAKADLVIFFTALYYPTVRGLPRAKGKTVLVPTAHDEPALKLSVYRNIFQSPDTIVFLSPEEREFASSGFNLSGIRQDIAGFGIECPETAGSESHQGSYLLYLGRIEEGKGCAEMFDFVLRAGLELKAAGPRNMPIPEGIDYRGIVSEEEKWDLLSGSRAMVLPSRNESLSITALEAWAAGKPVIVSSDSPVLAGQVKRSEGGLSYSGFNEFNETVKSVGPEMGRRGREFVQQNYSWEAVMAKWQKILRSTIED